MTARASLRETIASVATRECLPDRDSLAETVAAAAGALLSLPEDTRPRSRAGAPGGLYELPKTVPTLIVSDLHARTGFLVDVLGGSWCGRGSTLEALEEGSLSLLFLGDGFHSEKNGMDRWFAALVDYLAGVRRGQAMRAEMRDCLALMEIVMGLIVRYPRSVAFLKGNHENILNEEGEGNHPFRKFADEGRMVYDFFVEEYGLATLNAYAEFEKSLPVMARGARFIASHAEPRRAYSIDEAIGARGNHEVTEGLTWTGNGESADGSVASMIESFLPDVEGAVYFGGHRVVSGGYGLRAGGRFVQLHDPVNRSVACVSAERPFNPEIDVRSIT